MTAAALELSAVHKVYEHPTTVAALTDINLVVRVGEAVAITGASGAGKSTLLSILGTLEQPTSGTVRIAGIDTSALPDTKLSAVRAGSLGFVFQQFFLLEHLTVLDNVATGLLYRGLPARVRRERAAKALFEVGLAGRIGHRAGQLSGGERQRVAIARAVVGRPAVLLADEPTGSLDSATGAEITELLSAQANEHTTVVVITHNASVAATMKRQVRLHDGRIVSDTATDSATGGGSRTETGTGSGTVTGTGTATGTGTGPAALEEETR